MFALLGLLLVGALFGSLVTVLLTLIYGASFATEYGTLVAYPLMFLPPMMYAGFKSRSNAVFEQGYALDSNHFGKFGGIVCALMATAAVLAAAFMTDAINAQMPPMPKWLDDALTSMTQGKLWVNLLCVSIFAPLFEEWLCRGMVLRGLLNAKNYDGSARIAPVWAILISALFFAVIHANPWQAIPAFILGCLFGYIYYRTGSLKLTMLMHCVNFRRHLRADRFAQGDGQLAGCASGQAILGPVRRLRTAADPDRACLWQNPRPVPRRQLRSRFRIAWKDWKHCFGITSEEKPAPSSRFPLPAATAAISGSATGRAPSSA